jgi:hypothetical protein
MYATTCPPVMRRVETVTNLPRNGLGDNSDMYNGTTKLALPTAAPTILLPPIMPHTLPVKACHNAPITKSMSAHSMTFFLPKWSAKTPVSGLAMSAKRDVQLVMRLLSRVDSAREERSVPTLTKVEEITPVLEAFVSYVYS